MFGESAYLLAIIIHFSFAFFCLFLLQRSFFHSGYVINPLQPSSAIYGAPPFTGYRNLHPTSLCDELWFWCKHFFITVRYDYV